MIPKIISPILIVSPRKLVSIFLILSGLIASCTTAPPSSPAASTVEPPKTSVAVAFTPAPQVLEVTPAQTIVSDTTELFSSDRLGICFSYPQGYTQMPYNDTVQLAAPDFPDSNVKALFWFEISDSYNRTAEEIADQDMTLESGLSIGRSTVTLGGEQAVVLDGMPGQDLVRRVYVVHQQGLYLLTFSPTRSGNTLVNDQMEALYNTITSSWAWSPCSANE